jgi:hypothetical protein
MPWVGFEPTLPVFERAKAVHVLDRESTVIGMNRNYYDLNQISYNDMRWMVKKSYIYI